jgi:hypothetical protein
MAMHVEGWHFAKGLNVPDVPVTHKESVYFFGIGYDEWNVPVREGEEPQCIELQHVTTAGAARQTMG